MLSIYTDSFVKYEKIIKNVIEKGHQLKESLYLNFEDSYVYFFGNECYGRFKFNFVKKDDRVHKNFFVNAYNFLIFCNSYSQIDLDNFTFSCEGESFKLGYVEDSYDFPEFNFSGDIYNISSIRDIFKVGLSFTSPDKDSGFRGVFLQNTHLFAFNLQKLISLSNSIDNIDISIPYHIAKIVNASNCENILLKKDDHIYLGLDACELIYAGSDELANQNFLDENFEKLYNHESYIKLNIDDFIEEFGFILKFSTQNINFRVKLSVENNTLIIHNAEQDCDVIKKVNLIECTNDFTTNYWIVSTDLQHVLNSIMDSETKLVKLQLPTELKDSQNLIKVSVDNSEDYGVILILKE